MVAGEASTAGAKRGPAAHAGRGPRRPAACRTAAPGGRGGRRGLAAGVALALVGAAGCGRPVRLPPLEELNVLLVVIDTLGAEHVGCLAPGVAVTPNLDRLAERGVLFRRAYSPAPWTQPAVASLLTSRMPSGHGVLRLLDILGPEEVTLPELLAERGFATAGVISHGLLGAEYGYAQGFESWDESSLGGHVYVTSHLVTNAAIDWLAARPEQAPFFLFVHYFDPHYDYNHHPPYDLTSGYRGPLAPGMDIWELRAQRSTLTPEDVDYLVGLYREEIAYTDAQIGRLLAALRALGVFERTLIVVTADHGEEFMRHGWIGHTRTLYDELLHVPLIVALPGTLPPATVETPVSLLDLLPTLLDLSATPAAGGAWEGISLLPYLTGEGSAPGRRDLFAEVSFSSRPEDPAEEAEKTAFKTALLDGDLKLVHDLLTDRWQLFDRARDPEELDDLAAGYASLRRLQHRLGEWERSRDRARRQPAERALPTPAEIEQLRALGYVE